MSFTTTKAEDRRIFEEAVNGFGFVEIEQHPEGQYCEGCCSVHKRPTKMYRCDGWPKHLYCRHAVVRFFNPEEQL